MDVNENLAKLWNKRAEIYSEVVDGDRRLQDIFHTTADIYRICAKELMEPPNVLSS